MLLDRALKATVRDFSTIFLALFLVIGPLQLLLAMVFHDVLAVRELHGAIADFPPSRQVRGVGQDALSRARIGAWIATVVELLLLPLFMRVTGHVLHARAGGEVPTAVGAWRMVTAPAPSDSGPGSAGPTLAGSLVVAALVGVGTWACLMDWALPGSRSPKRPPGAPAGLSWWWGSSTRRMRTTRRRRWFRTSTEG
jgi:hypothetical protein